MRNASLIGLGLAGFAGLVFALFASIESEHVEAQSAANRAVESADAPKAIGPYSQAIVANGFVFAAGQIGTDPKTGTLVEGGITEQADQALKNIASDRKSVV